MKHEHPVTALINRWPSRAELAADISKFTVDPVPTDRVHKWAQSGAIPAGYHIYVVAAARGRGFSLSETELMRLHAAPSNAKGAA